MIDRAKKTIAWTSTLAVLAAIGCAKPPQTGPYALHPIAATGEAAPSPEATVVEHPGARIEIIPIAADPELDKLGERARRMRQLGITREVDSKDPFFVAFRVKLRSTGEMPLYVESQSIRLWLEDGRPGPAPLDYTRAYELLRPDQESPAGAAELEAFMKGLLDGAVSIPPGGTREGLLVFPSPSSESQRVLLEMPALQVGSKTHRVRVPFAKVFR